MYQTATDRLQQAVAVIKNASRAIENIIEAWPGGCPDDLIQVRDDLDEFGTSEYVHKDMDRLTALANTEEWYTYHQDGEHVFYSLADWTTSVANGDTVLGYEDWVRDKIDQHRLDFDAYIKGKRGNPIGVTSITPTTRLHRVEVAGEEEAHYIINGGGDILFAFPDAPDQMFLIGSLKENLAKIAPSPTILAINVEGGIVQAIITNKPARFDDVTVLIYDYDTDGAMEEDLIQIVDGAGPGTSSTAYARFEKVGKAGVDLVETLKQLQP